MNVFRESEHPRDNDGKFIDKGATIIPGAVDVNKLVAYADKVKADRENNSFAIDVPSAKALYQKISQGEYIEPQALFKNPVFQAIENEIQKYDIKYGVTAHIDTQERKEQRQMWIDDFLAGKGVDTMPPNGAPLKREYKATIVVGLPAAGKSTRIANPLSEEQGAFIFDSDEMKKLIPEYEGGKAANAVHQESKNLLSEAMNSFTAGSMKGVNMVIPIIGDELSSIEKKAAPLISAGYNVEIAYKKASTKDSINRVVGRAIKEGRYIPKKKVMEYNDDAVRDVYKQALKSGRVHKSKYSEL